MNKPLIFAVFIVVIAVFFLVLNFNNLKTVMNPVQISVNDSSVPPILIKVALLGDLHLDEGKKVFDKFAMLIKEIKSHNPDLILLVGDYVTKPSKIKDITQHRKNVINAFKLFDPIPRAVVLGNHDNWTDGDAWQAEFKNLDVDLLENKSQIMNVAGRQICIRGFGDNWSHKFKYIDYLDECEDMPKLTITHDPQGAFESGVEGLVFAGHTHCGQVSFPIIGPLKVPSKAPRNAICGLYKDSKRTLFVTSGIGYSLLPLRIGTQSNWDLINLSFD